MPTVTWAEQLGRPITALLRQPLVDSMVRLSAVEDGLRGLHPMLSLTEVRARVLRVIDETADCKTFVLRPNSLWRGAQAGQFVRLRVEIDGRRHERAYSLSRIGRRTLAISVKRLPGGQVSGHLHQHLRAGDVVTISQAMGEFLLPAQPPAKLLLLSAGSGITPLRAMRRQLLESGYTGDLKFLHISRGDADFIFGAELQGQADLLHHRSAAAGRFDAATLQRLVPDWRQRATWVCGPEGLLSTLETLWAQQGLTVPLHSERFLAAPRLPVQALGSPAQVALLASGRRFSTQGAEPLLMQAEAAGLTLKHGCRIGICRSCQCSKRSGTVQNLQTGELCNAPDQVIRLCISAARSDLQLDL